MKQSYSQEIIDILEDFHYSPIINYDYEHWFTSVEFTEKTLSDIERKEFIARVDEAISQYSTGLKLIMESLDFCRNKHDELNEAEFTACSVMLFVFMTLIDCMVSGKYFMMADTDYDRRFMRGKMKVILNEGFKRLYGFDEKTHKKSEWSRLEPLMSHCPDDIKKQYEELTHCLEGHSKSSSWWRDERNLETHLEAEKLYVSRMEVIVESKVMSESLKLFNTLYAAQLFLTNVHTLLYNSLVDKYNRGELLITNE